MISTTVQVNKRVKDEAEPRHAEFSYDYPESVQEALEKYGESLTLKLIHDSITLDVQGPARKVLEASPPGLSPEEYNKTVEDVMKNHQIVVKRTRGPAAPKMSAYQQMAQDLADPTKRDAIIERFRTLGINLDISANEEALSGNSSRR